MRLLGLCVIGLALLGCTNLDRFETRAGEEYCGGLESVGFGSSGMAADDASSRALQLGLTLDISKVASRPGVLRSNDHLTGLCAKRATFEKVPLRVIEPLLSDRLSTIQIAEDHEQEIFSWVDSSCLGTMVAIVSLLKNNDVEVRLMRPAPEPTASTAASARPGYGVFLLRKQPKACSF